MPNRNKTKSPERDVDDLIRAALVVNVDEVSVARLEGFWRRLSRRSAGRRRKRAAIMLIAASVGATALFLNRGTSLPDDGERGSDATVANVAPPRETVAISVGRPPTAYERLVFAARTSRRPTTQLRRRNAAIDERVERLLTDGSQQALRECLALVANPVSRAAAVDAVNEAPHPPIDGLLTLLDDDDKSVRLAAAIVLGRLNGPKVTQALIARVTDRPAKSTEAWIALMACRGDLAQEFLTYAGSRPQLLGHFNHARLQAAQMIP